MTGTPLNIRLPTPLDRYDAQNERELRRQIEAALGTLGARTASPPAAATADGIVAAEFYLYNSGSVLIAADSDWVFVPGEFSITDVEIVGDPAGTISVSLYACPYSSWDAWTLVSASAPITLTASDKNRPAMTGWTTAYTGEGTYFKCTVTGFPSLITKATISLTINAVNAGLSDLESAVYAAAIDRDNHTGTQLSSTISDFNSATRAQVESELAAGANITITPSGSGASRVLTIAGAAGSSVAAWVTYHPDNPPSSPTTFSGTVYDHEYVRDNAIPSGSTVLGAPATSPSIVDRALRIVSGTSGAADVKGIEWACPGSAFTMTCKLRRKVTGGTFGVFGPMLRRNASGAGNFMGINSYVSALYTTTQIEVAKYTSVTARSSTTTTGNFSGGVWQPVYFQMQYDGTNIITRVSFTGHADSYTTWFSETAATFLGGAPGRFGLMLDNFGTTANTGYCEWIRFT